MDCENERDIANAAAKVLRESFIAAAKHGTVLYVQDDVLWSKAPNSEPVMIKKLLGRNPDLAQRFASRKTFKIRKSS